MDCIASLTTMRSQYAYELDVHVRKKDKLLGGFGKTFYRAEWLNGKKSPIVLLAMEGQELMNEALRYISIDHTNIIKTYGLVKPTDGIINANSVLLLQEYAQDGDLYRLLTAHYFIPTPAVLLEIFIQISDAMVYLSKHDIIHGDLACRNVLVFKSHSSNPTRNLVKIIDFGLTRDSAVPLDVELAIPDRYVALEIIRSGGRSDYSEKSDVYSYAVLLWEAYSPDKRMPYDHINSDEEVCRQKLNGERLQRPGKCPIDIWTMMLKCWSDRPEDRPNFPTIYSQLKDIQNSLETKSNKKSGADYQQKRCRPSMQRASSVLVLSSTRDDETRERLNTLVVPPLSERPHTKLKERSLKKNQLWSTEQIPCENCEKLIELSKVQRHQERCFQADFERFSLERSSMRSNSTISRNSLREFEEREDIAQIECRYCKAMVSIDIIDSHENFCEQNPTNVVEPIISHSSSNDQPTTTSRTKQAKLSGLLTFLSRLWPHSKKE